MSFIGLAITGYLLLALEGVFSKYLLTGKIKSWPTYAFYVGVFSLFGLILLPFGAVWPGGKSFALALTAGGLFFISLCFLYQALERSAASRVYVLYGTLVTLGTMVLAPAFSNEDLTPREIFGTLLLLVGGFLISYKFYKKKFFGGYKATLVAGITGAVSLLFLKKTYLVMNFFSGYAFSRLGIFLGALVLLGIPVFRKKIKYSLKQKSRRQNTTYFFGVLGNKSLAGLGTILISGAIYKGSVTIVNALMAVQFLGTFLLATLLALFWKKELQEEIFRQNIIFKLLGVMCVVVGVMLVAR